MYAFRGGSQITGPSVDLAREMARLWGQHSVRVPRADRGRYDAHQGVRLRPETNAHVESEDKFRKLIQRKDKRDGDQQPPERDMRTNEPPSRVLGPQPHPATHAA